ncbi:MAG TPA: M48 family metalloprotease [Bacillota bacterium]|nr:M48 family metalloprotease [Bacillota bacterium]
MEWHVFLIRLGFIVGACFFLSFIRRGMVWLYKRSGIGIYPLSLMYKGVHLGVLAGLAALVALVFLRGEPLNQPLSELLVEDGFNFVLFAVYLAWYLFQSYQWERQTGRFRSGYGEYLKQYAFFQILLLDILLLLRLDERYLPWMLLHYPEVERFYLEAIAVLFFVGIQGIAVLVRSLKMEEAPREICQLVKDVAAVFGVQIRRVRVWQLELVGNAFATGLIRRSIFLTGSLVAYTAPDDLRMIVGHECAHFKLHHLEVRMAYVASWVWLGSFLLERYPEIHWIYVVFYGFAGYLLFNVMARRQEIQADQMAAAKLGGGAKMAEALVRTFGMGSASTGFSRLFRWFITHPEMEMRVNHLMAMDSISGGKSEGSSSV